MNKENINKLRELPIETVAERLGLTVSRHTCLCPFHTDHHPSLSFDIRRNRYHCFACGAKGDVIDLAMHLLGTSFPDTCQRLAADGGIYIPQRQTSSEASATTASNANSQGSATFDAQRYERFFLRTYLSPEAQKFLYTERKIDPRIVNFCRLTSWHDRQGTPWLQIPYFSAQGKLIGIQNRNLNTGAKPRFRFPKASRCSIYNLNILPLLHNADDLYITEGPSDCWAMLSAGHKAIAIPSATTLKRADIELIQQVATEKHLNIHMYPDQDLPGEQLFMQLQKLLPTIIRHQLPPGCKDFADMWKRV